MFISEQLEAIVDRLNQLGMEAEEERDQRTTDPLKKHQLSGKSFAYAQASRMIAELLHPETVGEWSGR